MAGRGRPKGSRSKGPGRPAKYTAASFKAAVDRYFRGIATKMPVSGVCNMDGNEIERVYYVIPPTISGLCLALGIDRRTWQNYADPTKHGGTEERPSAYARVCEDVKLRIEAYLNEQLLTREKSLQGIIFNLSNNYGWAEKHEHSQVVEFGEKTRETMAQNLTMDEKFALLREAAAEIAEAEDHGEEDE